MIKEKLYKNTHFLEFLITFVILMITSNGIFTALALGILFILLKSILMRFNKLPIEVNTNILKTLTTVIIANTLKVVINLIF